MGGIGGGVGISEDAPAKPKYGREIRLVQVFEPLLAGAGYGLLLPTPLTHSTLSAPTQLSLLGHATNSDAKSPALFAP